jgi:hypothetical protein
VRAQRALAATHRFFVCIMEAPYTFSSLRDTGGGFCSVTAAQNCSPNANASFTLRPGSFTNTESVSP